MLVRRWRLTLWVRHRRWFSHNLLVPTGASSKSPWMWETGPSTCNEIGWIGVRWWPIRRSRRTVVVMTVLGKTASSRAPRITRIVTVFITIAATIFLVVWLVRFILLLFFFLLFLFIFLINNLFRLLFLGGCSWRRCISRSRTDIGRSTTSPCFAITGIHLDIRCT